MKKYLITGATLMMCAALGFVTLTSFDEPDAMAAQEAALNQMVFEMEAPLLEELAQACNDRALEAAQQQLIEEGMKAPATSRGSRPSKPTTTKPSTTTTTTPSTTTTVTPPPPPPAPEKPKTTGTKWDTKDPSSTGAGTSTGTTTDDKWNTNTPAGTKPGAGTPTGTTTKDKWGNPK